MYLILILFILTISILMTYKLKKLSLIADIIDELYQLGADKKILTKIKTELHENNISNLKSKLNSIKQ